MPLLLLAAISLPFLYQAFGEWRDRRRYPPPGRVINGLHIHSTGNHGPSVVLESGIAGSSLSWRPVQELASQFASVSSYDRAGLGWSAYRPRPRTLDNLVADLHDLLHSAKVPLPVVLLGHSFGGLVVRHYAALHPSEVSGLILVDPVPISDWSPLTPAQAARLARGVRLSRRGAWLARLGVVRLGLDLVASGARFVPKLLANVSAGDGASVTSRLAAEVTKLPRELWPLIRAHWSVPKSFLAMADHLESLPANAANVRLPSRIRTIVLTPPKFQCEIPDGADHRIAGRSGHWIQLDEPDLVAQAIRDMVTAG